MIGSDFYRLVDRNEVDSKSLVRFRAQVTPIETQIRGLPQIAALEAAAMAWFQARFQDAAAAAERAEREEIALDWLRAQLADLRQSAGPAAFESAAAAWFQQLLLELDEVDAPVDSPADEPDAHASGGGDEEAARSVA
ncbi:MAG: hypothetical protein FJX28_08045 [Alphaproteobacteria bacterium]|nr:hypothetical protein [Alphaproteobacteria bacterium]